MKQDVFVKHHVPGKVTFRTKHEDCKKKMLHLKVQFVTDGQMVRQTECWTTLKSTCSDLFMQAIKNKYDTKNQILLFEE